MTISIELLATIISVTILLAGFVITRIKEAEVRGRLLQRIDVLEKTLDEMRAKNNETSDKINTHDGELVKLTSEIEALRDLVERIDKKLDQVLARG